MMSGAAWVRDRLAGAGWAVEVADARKVKNVAPLACKTDTVDARILAELCRRDLVPALWIPALAERALRERLNRRLHLVRLRTSAKNRVFGLLTQWGLRIPLERLRRRDAMELLKARGRPRSGAAPARAHTRRRDWRRRPLCQPAQTDRLRRPGPARQAVRSEFAQRRAVQGRLAHPALGRRRGRPGRLAPHQPVAPPLRGRQGPQRRQGEPAKAAVARKVLIACWHVLSREQPFKPSGPRRTDPVPASSPSFLAA